ncbi:MAG: phosphohistidine phosphatase SixA [Deltaproteobacteria bacterium]|nr:phosphohistidine phosphatase SixA [Deltaproteobacteria bacterium]MBW2152181.1 phosphohistidine phosphatase SixA [Deltaproteobacteria bacterium]
MALYLVQHGKSLPKEVDPDQGLSKEGISEVKRIADLAKQHSVKVSRIQHSGKTRARHTAEIFAEALGSGKSISERSGINPLDDVTTIAASLNAAENLMLVGHLPFMERLTSYLLTGSIEPLIFKFQNAGILCLDQDPNTFRWFIKWALMPNME